MKKPMIIILLALCCIQFAGAQPIKSADSLMLHDSLEARYVPSGACPNCYAYLPGNFRVAKNDAGQPEISLLKISETEDDPVTGGILHILFVWGLDAAQEAELQAKIRAERDSLAVIVGAVAIDNDPSATTFKIVGDDTLAKTLRSGVKNQSNAASGAGSKMAISFRFDETQVKTLLEFLDKKKASDAHFLIELNCLIPHSRGPGNKRLPLRLSLNFTDLYALL